MFKRISIGLLVVGALSAVDARAASISLDVSSPVMAGSAFDVAVLAHDLFDGRPAGDALLAFGFDVTIGNPAIFQYVGATVGPLFDPLASPPTSPPVFGFAPDPLLGIGPADFSGPLTLATLHFTALGGGATTISIASAGDPSLGFLFSFDPFFVPITGSVSVAAAAPVPEPSTLMLVTPAVVWWCGVRRRRRPAARL